MLLYPYADAQSFSLEVETVSRHEVLITHPGSSSVYYQMLTTEDVANENWGGGHQYVAWSGNYVVMAGIVQMPKKANLKLRIRPVNWNGLLISFLLQTI